MRTLNFNILLFDVAIVVQSLEEIDFLRSRDHVSTYSDGLETDRSN